MKNNIIELLEYLLWAVLSFGFLLVLCLGLQDLEEKRRLKAETLPYFWTVQMAPMRAACLAGNRGDDSLYMHGLELWYLREDCNWVTLEEQRKT